MLEKKNNNAFYVYIYIYIIHPYAYYNVYILYTVCVHETEYKRTKSGNRTG